MDEPDLVKTDGQRIVTISGGVLRVVDAQTHQLTGAIDLSSGGQLAGWTPTSLLLAGNHALVLFSQGFYMRGRPFVTGQSGNPRGRRYMARATGKRLPPPCCSKVSPKP